ncbi:MAG: zinc ribbon domain-containing protein [Deltaproteobacteria bacterium]|nr:zinc ribbon domain-containing protein [Deltaproteobacteria bacterium]
MPIYEYVCRSCGHAFEELVYGDDQVACPACKTREVGKVLSAFAVGRAEAAVACPPTGCGACGDPRGPGACRMN